jgi:phage baseplate assembly protein W
MSFVLADIITSSEWSISCAADGFGKIVQGQDDINQSILNILKTTKGTNPLFPEFGCNAIADIDQPVNKVVATMTQNIIEALGMFEPRINVTSVTNVASATGSVSFLIKYTLVNSVNTGQTNITFGT